MKKVLIITYYWPPSGGSGVQRWYKFAKYLPQFGWEPTIYTPYDPKFGITDDSLSQQGSDNIKVLRTNIWDLGTLFKKNGKPLKIGEIDTNKMSFVSKLLVWVRGNMFIPDAKVSWVKPSIKYLTKYLAKEPVDIVVTTGPPHSMHLIGLGLKKRLGVKWVADFRDPWSEGDIISQLKISGWAEKKHQYLENEVLANADAIVTVGNRLGDSFKDKNSSCNVEIITNGYDSDDFGIISSGSGLKGKFILTYSGLLYNNRNPGLLWEVLDEICRQDQNFRDHLQVNIAGIVDPSVEHMLRQFKALWPSITFHGYLSHTDSIQLCMLSTALILPVDNTKNTMMLIPGKLFEYLAVNIPILGFGDPDSDASAILRASGHNPLINYSDKIKITETITSLFTDFEADAINTKYDHDQYQRRNLTKKMVRVFEELLTN